MMVCFAFFSRSTIASPCRERASEWGDDWPRCPPRAEARSLVDSRRRSSPTYERDISGWPGLIAAAVDRGRDAIFFAHALFHHGAALDGVGVLVADEHAVFIVFVARDYMGVAGNAGNDAGGDAALGDLVSLVRLVFA